MNVLIGASLYVIGNAPLSNFQWFTTSVQSEDTLADVQLTSDVLLRAHEAFMQSDTVWIHALLPCLYIVYGSGPGCSAYRRRHTKIDLTPWQIFSSKKLSSQVSFFPRYPNCLQLFSDYLWPNKEVTTADDKMNILLAETRKREKFCKGEQSESRGHRGRWLWYKGTEARSIIEEQAAPQ